MHKTFVIWFLILVAVNTHADDIQCPPGSEAKGESTPEALEAWCEVVDAGKAVQQGPYRAWWPNGELGTEGQFSSGKAVGHWRGWYPGGQLQGEEWFENGVKIKSRYFDETGKEVEREPGSAGHPDGSPVRQSN